MMKKGIAKTGISLLLAAWVICLCSTALAKEEWIWTDSNEYRTVSYNIYSFHETRKPTTGVYGILTDADADARAEYNMYGAPAVLEAFQFSPSFTPGLVQDFHVKANFANDTLTVTGAVLKDAEGNTIAKQKEPLTLDALAPESPYRDLYLALACKTNGISRAEMMGPEEYAPVEGAEGIVLDCYATREGSDYLYAKVRANGAIRSLEFTKDGARVLEDGKWTEIAAGSAEAAICKAASAYAKAYPLWAGRLKVGGFTY